MLLGIKKFINLNTGIRKMIYKDESIDDIGNIDMLYYFNMNYKEKPLEESEEKDITDSIIQMQNKFKKDDILLSFKFLMYYILSKNLKKDDFIFDQINRMPIANFNEIQKEQYKIIKTFFGVEEDSFKEDEEEEDNIEQANNLDKLTVDKLISIYKIMKEKF